MAAVALALAPRIRSSDKRELLREAGSFRASLARLPSAMRSELLHRAEDQQRRSDRSGFSLVSLGDPRYPPLLRASADPPLVLYVWGSLEARDELSFAVVGSRRATAYGTGICERLSRDLSRRGATIVSGLARGIDAAAHRASLEAGGRTIAVLGSGLDVVYPREHRRLAERIAASGAVVSELALDTPPLPGHFPRRNRIVSGLALGTIVIEAAERSGSLISARWAVEDNREVYAVPGPITSPNSRGVHRLIQQGAKLVQETEDILEEMRPDIREKLTRGGSEDEDRRMRLGGLGGDEREILEAILRRGALDTDQLVRLTGLPAHRITVGLVGLEIQGRIRAFPGGFYGEGKPG